MEIELDYISGIAFYTLKGHKFGKQMTAYHTEGRLPSKKRSFLKCLREIPMDKPAIHDIRLNFTFKHFQSILYSNSSSMIKSKDSDSNHDIVLQPIEVDNLMVKTTVHNTSTVSVIVVCIVNPLPIDMFGLLKLTSNLARVEDRLQIIIDEYNTSSVQSGRQKYLFLIRNSNMPNHMSWTVKMWHFGRDALTRYSG